MLRNRDYRFLLIIMICIATLGSSIAFIINPITGGIVGFVTALLITTALLFSRRRYQDIKELSGYLRRIYSGDYSLDIRDNVEGELSILKSEIYKVTLILSKQANLLQKEKEQLANAISDISHQLKTPLTSMMVMAEVLSNNSLESEKRKEFTRNLELQLQRMEWLLTSLLKLSKIDAGTITFKKEEIALADLITQAMKPLLIPMELKEQKLVYKTDCSMSLVVDRNWTAEALINILKNCIEYTPFGGTITIQSEVNPIYTQILITDSGNGIAKEDLPYIFKRFYKGENASEESVGIGLAMAKSIIESQNGDINVTSQKTLGTSFSIKFYNQGT